MMMRPQNTEKKKKHVAEYELGPTLGEGAFGKVKLGILVGYLTFNEIFELCNNCN